MKTVFLLLLLLSLACENKKAKESYEPLSKEEMVSLLIDLHTVDGKIKVLKQNVDSNKIVYQLYAEELYKKHNTDSAGYIRSYYHYLEHPQDLDDIYTAVVDSLNLREKMLNKSAE